MIAFSGDLTTVSICLSIERTDGAGFAVTSYDRRLTIGLDDYDPAGGLMPNSTQLGDPSEPAAEFSSALDSGMLREEDLVLGRWDNARVTVSAASWEGSNEQVELSSGLIGEVQLGNGQFTADVVAEAGRMTGAVCPALAPECRATLGDKCCRIDLAPLRVRARIVKAQGSWLSLDVDAGDEFLMGSVRFLDGPLCGLTQPIVEASQQSIRLREDLATSVPAGTRLLMTKGCDKRAETCRARFGNIVNFRGEPHVPGTDFLMRYPGA